jgi:hypothetical protein
MEFLVVGAGGYFRGVRGRRQGAESMGWCKWVILLYFVDDEMIGYVYFIYYVKMVYPSNGGWD